MIKVKNLAKWFGPTLAVDHLTFEVPKGEVVGFLGPNGAGKSTTLRMLTGYLPPSSGNVTIDDLDVVTESEKARNKIGYLPESTPLYQEMRVDEFLHYRGKLMHMPRARRNERIAMVCDRCGLTANRRRVIGHLSKGNKQRVGVAQALLHDPPVLILDEPTAGLDPTQITHFRDLISELKGQHTIVLSTHILPEIEKTADSVMIIAGGRIVAQGDMDQIRQSIRELSSWHVEVKAAPQAVTKAFEAISAVRNINTTQQDGWTTATIESADGQDVREDLGQAIATNQWHVRELRNHGGTLEEFFIKVTAQQAVGKEDSAA